MHLNRRKTKEKKKIEKMTFKGDDVDNGANVQQKTETFETVSEILLLLRMN